MKTKFQTLCLYIIILITLSHCGLFEPSTNDDSSPPEIEFIVSGGFWGGIIEHLTLSEQGVVTLKTGYPELGLVLTKAQHDSILSYIIAVRNLDRTEYLHPGGGDDLIDIEIRINQKSYLAHYSYLYDHRNEPRIDVVYKAMDVLHDLNDFTYEQSAPWIGLIFDAFSMQEQYTVGDTVEVVYSLDNPTERSRALLFPHQYQILFQAEGGSCSGYCMLYPIPDERYSSDSPPSAINLDPGESWQMVFKWSQPFIDQHGEEMILEPGVYEIGMNMANGNFHPVFDSFEIVESMTSKMSFR